MQKNSPKISVIVPIYNVERFIKRCAESLMKQTLNDIEFIFVDDCTPDNSISVLQSVLNDYPDRSVKILRHDKNKGLACARLTGLKSASGMYVAHCDSDDWCAPDMYEKMYLKAIESDADIVACDYMENSEIKETVCTYTYDEEHKKAVLNPYAFGDIYGAVWNKLIRKSLYDNYHIFPIEGINMWEDSIITMRLRWYSHKTVILHEPLYHYWIGERKSIFFSDNNLRQVDEMVRAVHFFESFFVQVSALEIATPLLRRLKFLCKERLMSIPSEQGLKQWRNIFPENDKYVWLCRDYALTTKIKITLLHYLPQQLAWHLFKLRKRRTVKHA